MSDQKPNDSFARVATTLVGVLALALAAATFWNHMQSRRELLRMPRQERRELYQHVLRTMSSVCVRAEGESLAEYCREQAQYVALFPDCDESCRQLGRQFLARPTK